VVRAVVDEPVGLEQPQRLPDRSRAHTQLARQLVDAETLPRPQIAGPDAGS
jgi:hypothetical protein